MALTYDIGGVPTKQSVSNMLANEADWVRSVHDQADKYFRKHAQTLATDQQKSDAGLDIVTFPDDKTRLDTMKDIMFALVTLLEGGNAGTITDTRDFCAQVSPVG